MLEPAAVGVAALDTLAERDNPEEEVDRSLEEELEHSLGEDNPEEDNPEEEVVEQRILAELDIPEEDSPVGEAAVDNPEEEEPW